MLRAWSIALHNRKIRASLLLFVVLATVAFGPISAFGVYILLIGMFSDARDLFHLIAWGMVGSGGVIGIAGAWVRLLVRQTHFQTRPGLKWATAGSLAAGLLAAAFTFTGVLRNSADLMAWLMLPALAVGVFLLGATVGEVRPDSAISRGTVGKRPAPHCES
jgi:hypothetical protein